MSDSIQSSGWIQKFRNAFRGIRVGMIGGATNSFLIHVPMGIVVIVAGVLLGVPKLELGLLLICVGAVLSAELFNSALESLAKAITDSHNEQVRDALDIASGAVLVMSLLSIVVGLLILLKPLMTWISG